MSLFDTIFNNSSQAALNPLFSSSSKFKAAKAAEGSATAESLLVDTAKAARTLDKQAAKAGKAKKRKTATTIEVPPVELPVKQSKQKRHADTVSTEVTHTKKKQKVVINDADSSSVDKVKPAKKQKQSVHRSAAPASANATEAPNRVAASEADVMAVSDSQLPVDHKIQVQQCVFALQACAYCPHADAFVRRAETVTRRRGSQAQKDCLCWQSAFRCQEKDDTERV